MVGIGRDAGRSLVQRLAQNRISAGSRAGCSWLSPVLLGKSLCPDVHVLEQRAAVHGWAARVWPGARSWTLARARRELNLGSAALQQTVGMAGLLCKVNCAQKDCYSVLLPSLPRPLQQRWWAAAWLLACSWDRAALYCLLFRTDLWCPAALSRFF